MNFYGISLSADKATVDWESSGDGEGYTRKLVIKQCLLGHDAKPDEFNVVEVTAPGIEQEGKVKVPIAVLKVGDTQAMRSDLEFPNGPVTFKLVSGSGPVHIVGLQYIGVPRNFDEYVDEESEFEEDLDEDDDDDDVEDENPKKKAKLEPVKVKPAEGGNKESKKK